MKKLLLLSLVSLFFITSCSEEPIESLTNDTELQALKVESAKAELLTFIRGNNINSILRSKETLLKSSNTKSSSIQGINRSNIADYDHYNSIVERVINGDDYECDLTELDYYVQSIIADWDDNDRFLYSNLGASIVFDAAYVFDNVDGGQYYGPEGQFTNQMNRTYKDLLRFWNIPTDILLRDAHGNVFNDLDEHGKEKFAVIIDGKGNDNWEGFTFRNIQFISSSEEFCKEFIMLKTRREQIRYDEMGLFEQKLELIRSNQDPIKIERMDNEISILKEELSVIEQKLEGLNQKNF